jgi:hypothetical protein
MPNHHDPRATIHLWMKEVVEDMILYTSERGLPNTSESLKSLLASLTEELGLEVQKPLAEHKPTAQVIHLANWHLALSRCMRKSRSDGVDGCL